MKKNATYWSVLLVATLHVGFMILELTCWNTTLGRKLTGLSEPASAETTNIGLNPALYNGFLAFGLLWTNFALKGRDAFSVQRVFLTFIAGMGVVGAICLKNPGIFVLQALPAMIALGLNWQNRASEEHIPGID
jgi:putative membrane protein